MNNGYVKLWRRSMESRVWQNEGLWKLWCWCLMKASYTERWVSVKTGRGETEINIKPGQFIYGRKTAAIELKMKTSNVRNRMEKLKKMKNVDIQVDTHYSIITICNWGAFQCDEPVISQPSGQAKDRQRTGKGQAKDTNNKVKKDKKDNNVKKTDCPCAFPVTTEMSEYASSKKFHKSLDDLTEGFLQYHKAKGNKMADWYAAWQTWLRNDIKFNGAGNKEWQ